MKHFDKSEFGESWAVMSRDLLEKLDEWRGLLGFPVIISPAQGALARYLSKSKTSQHNVDRWGECRAADVMSKHFETVDDMRRGYDLAVKVGFTGIGASMIWRPHAGFHLDVRKSRDPGSPAKWGYARVDGRQKVVGVGVVLGGVRA